MTRSSSTRLCWHTSVSTGTGCAIMRSTGMAVSVISGAGRTRFVAPRATPGIGARARALVGAPRRRGLRVDAGQRPGFRHRRLY